MLKKEEVEVRVNGEDEKMRRWEGAACIAGVFVAAVANTLCN